ncbi:hypothetical protein DN402_10630 [Streptomyces sp. SW4]|nr:hypothetical protein DN402_10630 [Streptomyces sp. SW4]
MGFTIGSSRGIRDLRTAARRRGRSSECTTVAEFTGLWGWDVVPGARAAAGVCSCGRRDCRAPGAHPLEFAPEVPAGSTLDEVTRAWSEVPGASVMLPVGRTFDVIEVAESAGRRALARLERMGLPSARSPRPRRAARTSSSPPGPPPSCRGCSTAWGGTRRPGSTSSASGRARTSRLRRPIGAGGGRCGGCGRRGWTRRPGRRRRACSSARWPTSPTAPAPDDGPRPAAPTRPVLGAAAPDPRFGLNGLVLKRRTGWQVSPSGV